MRTPAVRRARHLPRTVAIAALGAAATLGGLVGCADSESPEASVSSHAAYRGLAVDPPFTLPETILTDTEGEPFDLRDRAAGKLVFIFVGYTNCPDICPVQIANVAAVLRQNPAWDGRVTVVFVTADPERDTPERLREWLNNFNPRFVGLRGTYEELHAFEDELHLARSIVPDPREGNYAVGHAAQMIAFAPDGRQVIYPFGIRQEDYAHDIPRLLAPVQ